jgi:putative tryptophan/tyrosine transport system substrate-binding protein
VDQRHNAGAGHITMRRRELIILLAGAAAFWPGAAHAQQTGRVYRIAYLFLGAQPPEPQNMMPWPTLRVLGYVEGANLIVERRFADGRRERLGPFASELIALKPDLILAQGGQSAEAVSKATHEIPIIIIGAGDPVGTGLVESLARPGGDVTGVTEVSTELTPKRLQLLKEVVPAMARVAVLWNAADRAMNLRYREIEAVAKALNVEIRSVEVRDPEDFERAFATIRADGPDAMFMVADALTSLNRKRIIEFAAQSRLPTAYEYREFVNDGGLMSYGPNLRDLFSRAAYYMDKILKGAKPTELPMEQPTKFELVINMKTAKALGLTVPQSLLARADEVIE